MGLETVGEEQPARAVAPGPDPQALPKRVGLTGVLEAGVGIFAWFEDDRAFTVFFAAVALTQAIVVPLMLRQRKWK
jgi:hypothetical protein